MTTLAGASLIGRHEPRGGGVALRAQDAWTGAGRDPQRTEVTAAEVDTVAWAAADASEATAEDPGTCGR
jgi:hypothetical protein